MDSPNRYWKAVWISTAVLCAAAALAWFVVPGVRAGTVPAVGGLVWHALGALHVLLIRTYAPLATRVGDATSPALGAASLPGLIAASALLLSLVACLPLRLLRKR